MTDDKLNQYLVDVAHPGSVNTTYAMVASLAEQGLLGRFDTGIYFKEDQWNWLLQLFPARVRAAVARELKRRQSPGLPLDQIFQHPVWEIACIAGARLGLSGDRVRGLRDRRNARFDQMIATRLHKGSRPDLLVVQDGSALHSLEAARQVGVPTVLNQVIGHYSHGRRILLEEEERFPQLKGQLVKPRSNNFLESVAREPAAADWIFAPSDYVTETVVAQGASRDRVLKLPYSVDTSRFQAGDDSRNRDGPCRLLFVGQVSQRKGIIYLLEAIKQLKDPDVELTLVGTLDGGQDALEGWLADYRGCFKHLSNVPYGEVHALYRQADVFVYPSLHEGSPMAIFEAMASGLPVITTPNSGSVVTDGREGYLVPIRDVEGLKDRITELKNNADLRREMGRAARKESENYAPDRYGERLAECLKVIRAGAV
ncbi:glycosyltransferase family 4 protein [Rhodovibrionaceae bacterium A322]